MGVRGAHRRHHGHLRRALSALFPQHARGIHAHPRRHGQARAARAAVVLPHEPYRPHSQPVRRQLGSTCWRHTVGRPSQLLALCGSPAATPAPPADLGAAPWLAPPRRFSSDQGRVDDQLPLCLFDALQTGMLCVGALVLVSIAVPVVLPVFLPLGLAFTYYRNHYIATSREVRGGGRGGGRHLLPPGTPPLRCPAGCSWGAAARLPSNLLHVADTTLAARLHPPPAPACACGLHPPAPGPHTLARPACARRSSAWRPSRARPCTPPSPRTSRAWPPSRPTRPRRGAGRWGRRGLGRTLPAPGPCAPASLVLTRGCCGGPPAPEGRAACAASPPSWARHGHWGGSRACRLLQQHTVPAGASSCGPQHAPSRCARSPPQVPPAV